MYIRTPADLILVLTAQKANVTTYQLEVGASGQDITDINNALNDALAINTFADSVDVDKRTVTQLRDSYYKGDPKEPLGNAPLFQVFAWSGATPTGGQIPLANTRNRRFDSSPTITSEARVAMMLESQTPSAPDPGTLKPTLAASAGQGDYLYALMLGNRGGITMWELEVQAVGTAVWTNVGRFDGKSQDVTYNPGVTTGPVQIRIRVRLWKSSSFVGLWSDEVTITVNP